MTEEGKSVEVDPKSLKGKIAIGVVSAAIILALLGTFIPSARAYEAEVIKMFLDVVRIILPVTGG